jgi:hypothetical protein
MQSKIQQFTPKFNNLPQNSTISIKIQQFLSKFQNFVDHLMLSNNPLSRPLLKTGQFFLFVDLKHWMSMTFFAVFLVLFAFIEGAGLYLYVKIIQLLKKRSTRHSKRNFLLHVQLVMLMGMQVSREDGGLSVIYIIGGV